jgi:ABC-type ATPase involved in cell division
VTFLFPKLTKTVKPDYKKNLRIYEKQLEMALEDGKISKKEKRMLKGLRSDLGITFEDHELLKRKIHSKMRIK